ncbi:MAG: AGE family epimerase/isomerase, partial [Opitutaceae bacterium]
MEHLPDRERGGFFGEIGNNLAADRDAPRGSVIPTRVLWTFSAAYRLYGNPEYREMADFALEDVVTRFWDKQHGGLYWTITADGEPLDDRKQIYAQVFGIYALSEYARATGGRPALERAIKLFQLIEEHAHDPEFGGYFEACTADWQLHGPDVPSVMGAIGAKSQNTHLHAMEACTNLLRVWPNEQLREKQRALVGIMLDRILNPDTNHLHLFLAADWTPVSKAFSFGHDIQNGARVATNGDLRLGPTPGQWQPVPKVGERQVDRAAQE